jgi:hypothetical protein
MTHKRVFYTCCCTILILFSANLSFINLSGIRSSRNHRKYCGLDENSITVDLLTASILPIGMYLLILSLLISSRYCYGKYTMKDMESKCYIFSLFRN